MKRLFGLLLFGWMAIAVVGSVSDLRNQDGTRFWTGVAAVGVCATIAAIGFAMVLQKSKTADTSEKPRQD